VLNLSFHPLNIHEISLLSKGLKFIPKPSKSNQKDLDEAFTNYSRRLKLIDFFSNSKIKTDGKPKKCYPKSKWEPPPHLVNSILLKEIEDL
jgi:hypothetical protein